MNSVVKINKNNVYHRDAEFTEKRREEKRLIFRKERGYG
jgi:hypothetical protein